jgi:pSer/pThr/pTyr-binding forkhead associated (FHA) protein
VAAAEAPARGPASRALVRLHEGAEVPHALGHRTTIGRTADNDIQIDAHNVSRHHAVVLETAEGIVVEDLNSTNGVQVNGRRVTRQVLADGDRLTIGKTDFTFRLQK